MMMIVLLLFLQKQNLTSLCPLGENTPRDEATLACCIWQRRQSNPCWPGCPRTTPQQCNPRLPGPRTKPWFCVCRYTVFSMERAYIRSADAGWGRGARDACISQTAGLGVANAANRRTGTGDCWAEDVAITTSCGPCAQLAKTACRGGSAATACSHVSATRDVPQEQDCVLVAREHQNAVCVRRKAFYVRTEKDGGPVITPCAIEVDYSRATL